MTAPVRVWQRDQGAAGARCGHRHPGLGGERALELVGVGGVVRQEAAVAPIAPARR